MAQNILFFRPSQAGIMFQRQTQANFQRSLGLEIEFFSGQRNISAHPVRAAVISRVVYHFRIPPGDLNRQVRQFLNTNFAPAADID